MNIYEVVGPFDSQKVELNKAMAERQMRAIYVQTNLLFDRLMDLLEKYPNDILVGAFPDENDNEFAHPRGAPLIVQQRPQDFAAFEPDELIMYDGEMQNHESFDHPHEKWYVRKAKPQLVGLVKTIMLRFNATSKMLRKLRRIGRPPEEYS